MRRYTLLAAAVVLVTSTTAWSQWKIADAPLITRWGETVTPERVLPEYPRPQMVRDRWLNLNGLWEYAIAPRNVDTPDNFEGSILVPFPVESALSGVGKQVGANNRLFYRRTFTIPRDWAGERVILHFGAVDWETEVWVNGRHVGSHRGGYDPFSFDITDALTNAGEQELLVRVWDPTDKSYQPRGKQHGRPHGIWYTPVTGIWQTVWLEPVPQQHIRRLRITPDIDNRTVRIQTTLAQPDQGTVELRIYDGDDLVAQGTGAKAAIELPNMKLWWPDDPFLYNLKVLIRQDGRVIDEVDSYFGMRKIALGKDDNGVTRIFLNNKFLFQYGLLDQGWWPDGLYTAPTDEALRYDIEITKRLGFNMARKHVKVEPARWYYWADKLGLLVWQDMPSGDRYIGHNDPDIQRTSESAAQFEREYLAMIDSLYNHPSIVMWVPFNEGWGQFDTARIVELTRRHDPTRLVNNASGWTDRGVGDVHDIHVYPGPGSPKPEANRAAVLGEFGGLGLVIRDHLWKADDNWGYRSYDSNRALQNAYLRLIEQLRFLIAEPGLSAAVYTQTTDVEIEVNGLMTYDRRVLKFDVDTLAAAHQKLYSAAAVLHRLVPSSRHEPQTWRYTFDSAAPNWHRPDFDDSNWREAVGGFGTHGTPGAVVRTVWNNNEIHLRRAFDVDTDAIGPDAKLYLIVHHDEDARIYLNGVLAAELSGYVTDYTIVPLSPQARRALRNGRNVIAVHCRQTTGGQYIDVGLAWSSD